MKDLGKAVLRMQADRASFADLHVVITSLLTDAEFRTRNVASIGALTQEIEQPKREEYARAMAMVLLTDFTPPQGNGFAQHNIEWFPTTPHFVRHCSPPPRGAWEEEEHIQAQYNNKGKADVVQVSSYLHSILEALEEMWGVHGHLVRR